MRGLPMFPVDSFGRIYTVVGTITLFVAFIMGFLLKKHNARKEKNEKDINKIIRMINRRENMIKTTNNIATIKNSYRVICDNSQALCLIEDKITKNEIRKKYISNISIEIDELINQRLFDLLSQEYELFSKKLITKSKMYKDCSDARSTARNDVLNYDELFSLINRIEECCKD